MKATHTFRDPSRKPLDLSVSWLTPERRAFLLAIVERNRTRGRQQAYAVAGLGIAWVVAAGAFALWVLR